MLYHMTLKVRNTYFVIISSFFYVKFIIYIQLTIGLLSLTKLRWISYTVISLLLYRPLLGDEWSMSFFFFFWERVTIKQEEWTAYLTWIETVQISWRVFSTIWRVTKCYEALLKLFDNHLTFIFGPIKLQLAYVKLFFCIYFDWMRLRFLFLLLSIKFY